MRGFAAIGMKGRGQKVARFSGHIMIKHYKNNELSVAIVLPIKGVMGYIMMLLDCSTAYLHHKLPRWNVNLMLLTG